MKKVMIIAVAFSFILASCTKEQPPIFEITYSILPSEDWDKATFNISDFGFLQQSEEGTIGGGILQQWNGIDLQYDLNEQQTFLVANDDHWAMTLVGVHPYIGGMYLSKGSDNNEVYADIPYFDYIPLDTPYIIEDEQAYRIHITFDLDKALYEEDGKLKLAPSYSVEVSQI